MKVQDQPTAVERFRKLGGKGGSGHDKFLGDAVDDLILARDNARDTPFGGDGDDRATVDDSTSAKDLLGRNRIHRRAKCSHPAEGAVWAVSQPTDRRRGVHSSATFHRCFIGTSAHFSIRGGMGNPPRGAEWAEWAVRRSRRREAARAAG